VSIKRDRQTGKEVTDIKGVVVSQDEFELGGEIASCAGNETEQDRCGYSQDMSVKLRTWNDYIEHDTDVHRRNQRQG
jgi:hypothetical protein